MSEKIESMRALRGVAQVMLYVSAGGLAVLGVLLLVGAGIGVLLRGCPECDSASVGEVIVLLVLASGCIAAAVAAVRFGRKISN